MQKRLWREIGEISKLTLVCLSGSLLPQNVMAQSPLPPQSPPPQSPPPQSPPPQSPPPQSPPPQSPPKPSPAADTDVFASDARLQQAVAVHAEGVPVGDLLALLAQKTGITLKADLYVADDKVIVFSPARPLRDTLRDIAILFNDEWEAMPLPNGQTRYTLVRRLKARHYEDDLEQEVTVRMLAQMDAQVKALSETPEQLAKRPADDPIRRNLEAPSLHARQATRLYAQLSREQRRGLFADGHLNVSFAASTPPQQAMAREAFGEVTTTLKTLDEKQRAEFPNVHIVIDTPDVLEQHGMRFHLTRTNNAGLSAQVLQVILGQNTYMTMGTFDSGAQWLLPPHGDPHTRKATFQGLGQGSFHTSNPYQRKDTPPSIEFLTPESIHKADGVKGWIDRLSALSQAADTPVMADYYRSPALVHDLKDLKDSAKDKEEAEAAGAPTPEVASSSQSSSSLISSLDALCRPSGYLWWTAGKTLLLRKRDWYAQRRYEVSDGWMRSVAGRLRRQKNVPTYADLSRLLELTPPQIAGLNGALEGAGEALADLETQEGLHELLTWIQASKEAWQSLPVGEPAESENKPPLPAAAQNAPQQAPPQIPLLGAFLNTVRQPATPDTVRNFSAQAYCYTPDRLKIAQAPAAQNVQVHLQWKVEGGSRILNVSSQHWMLWLPLHLPADRTDRTTIDMTPATK